MFKCPNTAHIVQIRDFSCKKVQSTDSEVFFQCLKFFFPVWRVGVNLNFFPVVKSFFFQCLPREPIVVFEANQTAMLASFLRGEFIFWTGRR